jgi:hypothetical protein
LNSAKLNHVVSYLDPVASLEGREVVSEAEPATPARREAGQ